VGVHSTSVLSDVAADDPNLADAAHEWKSAYVHIPFCRRRCPYCDFVIVDESTEDVSHDRYVAAILAEIEMEQPFGVIHALNFGGGTPSTLTVERLGAIIGAVHDRFGFIDDPEVSLEINPEDWNDAYGAGLIAVGFTRISIGGQSMDDTVLGVLGRSHTAEQLEAAVVGARRAGFRSVSVDLIMGHPGESAASWTSTVEGALALPIDHVSTYALTVERGTDLWRSIADGAPGPDGDLQADRYDAFVEASASRGFARYEVSNHARPGHVCRYNLATWAHGEYVGFGVGAHDHRWGIRSRNHRRIDRYLEDVERGERPRLGSEELTIADQERDRLMLGLRLGAGTPMTPTAETFLASSEARRLIEAGILDVVGERVVVLKPFLADAVVREALSVTARDC
jgi:putative oxygen-independent coproporphyrinogen III oxidase